MYSDSALIGRLMKDKEFIFLAGLHRSGTSLLHEIIREHPEISGFSGTGAPEDEGQHLQTVYRPAKAFGGPGKFAFDTRSYMDELHPLATHQSAITIFKQWSAHFDLSRPYLIEKSPPNIIRTRFLQKLFPRSKFIVILRHPLAVSYATRKWSKTSIPSLLEHSLLAYEIFFKDMNALDHVYIIRYEQFVIEPQRVIDSIFSFLGLGSITVNRDIRKNVNEKYFLMWENEIKKSSNRIFNRIPKDFEARSNNFGYSIKDYDNLVPAPWLGAHNNTIKSSS
jgi:hypothetical protein